MTKQIRNEQIKLRATAMNTLGVTSFTFGAITPIITSLALIGEPGAPFSKPGFILGECFGVLAGICLMASAQKLLESLEE